MRYKAINLNVLFTSGIILLLGTIIACHRDGSTVEIEPVPGKLWTIMYYGDADNDLELYLLNDVAEMKAGFVDGQGVNMIVLFDRINSYSNDSTVFGQDFIDTRLYRVTSGKTWQLDGLSQFPKITAGSVYEANMGDGATLKKFIMYCKENYPAEKYALIISNHGGGPMKKKSLSYSVITESSEIINKDISYDKTSNNDFLFTAEISDNLTSDESVDLFGLDACFMASIEFAYQFRNDISNSGFKAGIMVASAPEETGKGWEYADILGRLQSCGGDNNTTDSTLVGYEKYYDPATLTAEQFGAVIVEEQRDSTFFDSSQSLTCFDLSKITAVKSAVDTMAVKLSAAGSFTTLENLRGNAKTASLLHYFDADSSTGWVYTPYFDLYNLAAAIESHTSDFSLEICADAASVKNAVDDMVLYSFANSDYTTGFPADPFIAGKSGVHIFFPDGDYVTTIGTELKICWSSQSWYNAVDQSSSGGYGELKWCIDSKSEAIGDVGNWFELLDSWYDTSNGTSGGLNDYRW